MQSQPIAVVVGACGHGLAIIRALSKGNVPIIALEANPKLPGVQTRLARVEIIPDINGPRLIDSLLQLRDRLNCDGMPVLFLTNDRMIRTIGEGWDRLKHAYHLSWSHSRDTMLPLLEKATLEARCAAQKMAYPMTYVLTSTEDVGRAIEAVGLPIFVKPSRPLSRFKTSQPSTIGELADLTRAYTSDLPFLVQRFIPGDDTNIYFSAAYLDHGKVLARFDGHKLRSRPLGHTTVAEACTDDEVFRQTCKFFDGLNLSGPVSLELKRDRQGVLWVIEPTVGRTDFWIDLCTENGVNLPLIEYWHQVSRPFSAPIQENRVIWFNEERDPFGLLWFFSQKGLRMKDRSATFLFLHRTDIKPALLALKGIAAFFARAVLVRVRRLLTGSTDSQPANVRCFGPSDDLPIDVQQFFAQAEGKDVEFGFTWYKNLVATVYPNDRSIRIYVLRLDGQPVAALPVRVIKRWLNHRVESLSDGYYTALYAPVVTPTLTATSLSVLITAIRNEHTRVGSFQFSPMDPQSTSYRTLMEALSLSGLLPYQFFCFGNWYLPVIGDWPTYLRNREGALRSTIKRMAKKFLTEGGTLELVQGGASLDRALAAYKRVYASSWKKAEPYPKFIPGLVRACAEQGWLRLGVAWLNGEPIAVQLWIVANGKANIYKLAYAENYRTYSPGTLLTAMLMEHAIERDRVAEVDYLIGDDPYKKSWMSLRRERWGIVAYNPKTILGMVGLSKEVCGRTLKPIVTRVRVFVRNMWGRLPT